MEQLPTIMGETINNSANEQEDDVLTLLFLVYSLWDQLHGYLKIVPFFIGKNDEIGRI